MAARQREPRVFRIRKDPLAIYDDDDLIKRYRLDAAGIRYLDELLGASLEPSTLRNKSIPSYMQIAIGLRYLATGKMQLCNGDDFGVSQPTICRIIGKFLDVITTPRIVRSFIQFPNDEREIRKIQSGFYNVAGFPGVVGVIDGTHIRIIAPSDNEAEYVNRKNFHSINIQVVFDHNYNLLNMVAKWPGSTHDARILRQSGLYTMFEEHRIPRNPHLLGDSGYPSKRWLLTPYLRPTPGQQTNYNSAHKRTRSIVERGIGQLKRRFHVLHSEIRLNPTKAAKVVLACGILHNLCKRRNIPLPDDRDEGDNENNGDDEDEGENDDGGNVVVDGNGFRQHITNTFFN